MRKLHLFVQSVFYLKPIQVFYRLLRLIHLRIRCNPVVSTFTIRRFSCAPFLVKPKSVEFVDGRYNFFFLSKKLSFETIDWNSPNAPKLWLYNLHYFDYINSNTSSHLASNLLSDWIANNPPFKGNGWEPYTVSLRIVNFVKWSLRQEECPIQFSQSFAFQAQWLFNNIEYHILGNHLFANAKALIFAGLFFESEDSIRWLKKGAALLRNELAEQILLDGGHFELSPMYHSIILEDILDLLNIIKSGPKSEIPSDIKNALELAANRALSWLKQMTFEDGEIAFFNDAALDIAPKHSDLVSYSYCILNEKSPPLISSKFVDFNFWHGQDSGYIRLSNSRCTVIMDVARVGPDYLTGHSHADTLSFEASIDGRRIFVNGGTSTYDESPRRSVERSTQNHNTVIVNNLSSSEVWASFRTARRARPRGLCIKSLISPSQHVITCSHDGYSRLTPPVTHSRTWIIDDQSIEIQDTLIGLMKSAYARFILHPSATLSLANDVHSSITIFHPEISAPLILSTKHSSPRIVTWTYSDRFGHTIPTVAIDVPFVTDKICTKISIQ